MFSRAAARSIMGGRGAAGVPRPFWSAWTWSTILLVGCLIREGFSFWTGHPYDFEIWIRTGYEVAHGTNPYIAFWPAVPGSFTYPPPATLPSAAYPPLWSGLLGGLYWLWEHVGFHNRFVLYFLLKQPPIAGDVLSAYFLYRLVGQWTSDETRAKYALTFWSLFPYDILISAIWGQFDSLVVAVLLGLLFALSSLRRNLLYGLGILLKYVTLIYLPLEIFRQRGLRRLWFLVGLVTPIAASGLIFLALRWHLVGFTATVSSESHGGPGGMNYVRLITTYPAGGFIDRFWVLSDALPYLWVPVVILGAWVAARWIRSGAPGQELRALLFILILFLVTRWALNEQYWIYLYAPLLLDVVVFHPGRRRLLYSLIGIATVFLVLNNTFLFWFAAPVNADFWTTAVRLDQVPIFNPFRQYTLDVLAGVITVSLVQAALVFYRDDPNPEPWFLGNWKFWRRSPTPAAVKG
jgi:hypothetical protein